jgi:transcriptional activator of cad operon
MNIKDKISSDSKNSQQLQIGEFRFEPKTQALYKQHSVIKLEPQVAQLLGYFVQNHGQILSREKITAFLWPKRMVSDDALRSTIKKLRDALRDDAKSPKYIKTLPLKGYEFVCAVVDVPTQSKTMLGFNTWQNKSITFTLGLFLLSFLAWQINISSGGLNEPSITKLTAIAGSELFPSFDNKNNRLIFSHRENKDDFLQLYIKDMTSKKVTRLTWGEANYANALWSPDGTVFAYTRSTQTSMTHYLSEFDVTKGMTNIRELKNETLNARFLLAWSRDKQAIYVTDKPGPAKPQGIWLYNISSNRLEQITSPSVPGRGDYFVRESFDGTMLAIIRSLSLNKHELLVLHLETGEIMHTQQLEKRMHRLVWSEDNRHITLANFEGLMLRLSLAEATLENITPNAPFVNHLFYQCGENCYYMRQHTGNYLDIAEQPNPFVQKNIALLGHFELAGANDFPMYANTSDKLFLVSQYSDSTDIEYFDNNRELHTVKRFDAGSEVQSIALNASDTHFVGLIDSTLFTYNISDTKLTILSKQTDIVYPPNWVSDKAFVYAKLEKNQPVLYKYSLIEKTSTFIDRGYISAIEVGDGTQLKIDNNYDVWREQDKVLTALVKLPSSLPNRFKLVGDTLYYTGRIENIRYLYTVSISTGEQSKMILAKNRFKGNFDISANTEKLAVVKSLLAQSDLVEVELHH